MSLPATSLLDEKQELLAFLPPVSFGYLYHSTGGSDFLTAGIITIVLSTMVYEGLLIDGRSKSWDGFGNRGRLLVLAVVITPWILSFGLSVYFLYSNMSNSDIFIVGLFFLNSFVLVGLVHDMVIDAIEWVYSNFLPPP